MSCCKFSSNQTPLRVFDYGIEDRKLKVWHNFLSNTRPPPPSWEEEEEEEEAYPWGWPYVDILLNGVK